VNIPVTGRTLPAAMNSHPICLAHLTLIELTPPQLVDAAAAAGFDLVSMRLAPASETEHQHPMIGGTPMMRETLARLRDLEVRVNDVELVRLTAATDVTALEPLVAAAAELGARHEDVAGDDTDEAGLARSLAALCALGDRYGVKMGLEFMPWRGIRDIASARRVLAAAGAGGIIVDAIHLDRSGGTAAEVAAIPPAQWAYFQICDAPALRPRDEAELLFQARQARLAPGTGGLDLVGMLRAIPAHLVVSIETPMHGLPGLLPPVQRARMLREATLDVLAKALGHD
jgi:sugar phosphate isomerase/epimerase